MKGCCGLRNVFFRRANVFRFLSSPIRGMMQDDSFYLRGNNSNP
jgi:hypothetical protein